MDWKTELLWLIHQAPWPVVDIATDTEILFTSRGVQNRMDFSTDRVILTRIPDGYVVFNLPKDPSIIPPH